MTRARPSLAAALCLVALAAMSGRGTPPPGRAASPGYRLVWLAPTGGAAEMTSARYSLRARVAPPPSGLMRGERYRILPLLPAPPQAPEEARTKPPA